MSKTSSQPKEIPTPARMQIEDLKRLEGLLRIETDRWSRQVILTEAAIKLAELERQLADSSQRAS